MLTPQERKVGADRLNQYNTSRYNDITSREWTATPNAPNAINWKGKLTDTGETINANKWNANKDYAKSTLFQGGENKIDENVFPMSHVQVMTDGDGKKFYNPVFREKADIDSNNRLYKQTDLANPKDTTSMEFKRNRRNKQLLNQHQTDLGNTRRNSGWYGNGGSMTGSILYKK